MTQLPKWAFWVILFAVFAGVFVFLATVVRRGVQRLFRTLTDSLLALHAAAAADEEKPRSLSGQDRILLPKIRRDFPDFQPELAKRLVREELQKRLAGAQDLKIYTVVLHDYRSDLLEKLIIFQAALSVREQDIVRQKRYILHYALATDGDAPIIGTNCPNCGAPIPSLQTSCCEYCGTRLVRLMQGQWRFTQVFEG